jgi:hypothetical protein
MAAAAASYQNSSNYWSVLFETLKDVFNRQDATILVADLRLELQKASPEEQLLFFHSEPFDVALTLTGEVADPTLISNYLSLVQRLNWGP